MIWRVLAVFPGIPVWLFCWAYVGNRFCGWTISLRDESLGTALWVAVSVPSVMVAGAGVVGLAAFAAGIIHVP